MNTSNVVSYGYIAIVVRKNRSIYVALESDDETLNWLIFCRRISANAFCE